MKIKKLTYSELESAMYKFNAAHNITGQSGNVKQYGIIVFTKDSFNKEFSEAHRSYMIDNLAKAFFPRMIGYSLSGDCLDGTDTGVRLDWYMKDKKPWKVEYCYIVENMQIVKVSKEDGSEKPVSLYNTLCLTEGRGYWKAGTVAQMLAEGQEVQTPFAIFKKIV